MRQYGVSSAHFHTSHMLHLNRSDVHNTHTRSQSCIVTHSNGYTTIYTIPSSMAPIKLKRQRRPNKQLFVLFSCSTRKMLSFSQSRKSSSFFLVVASIFFSFHSVSESFRLYMRMASEHIYRFLSSLLLLQTLS